MTDLLLLVSVSPSVVDVTCDVSQCARVRLVVTGSSDPNALLHTALAQKSTHMFLRSKYYYQQL
jgi:hypothetical protein